MAEMNPTTTAAPSPLLRLPGRSPLLRLSRVPPRATLWLDSTQLVQANVNGYTQEILRFSLADIHAFQVRRTSRGLTYNVILVALAILPLIGLANTWVDRSTTVADRVILGCVAGFFLLLLIINLLRGATCRTTLVTALGPQILPSLCRMRATERALVLVINRLVAVQGALRPDEAAQAVDRARVQTPSAPAPAGAAFQSYNY